MKRLISIVLLSAMLVSCFAGCGMQKGQIDLNAYAGTAVYENAALTAPTNVPTDNVSEWEGGDLKSIGGYDEGVPGLYTITLDPNNSANNKIEFKDSETSVKTQIADITWYTVKYTEVDEDAGEDAEEPTLIPAQNEYVLDSAADFAGFLYLLSVTDFSGAVTAYPFTGITIKLACNVDLNGVSIEHRVNQSCFEGNFDGQNHAIFNFEVENSYGDQGLFGNVKGNASIKNLSLLEGTFTHARTKTDAKSAIGAFVGKATVASGETVTFENLYTNCTVQTTESNTAAWNGVGGVVGIVTGEGNVIFKDCVNAGAINMDSKTSKAGGLVGYANASGTMTVTDCKNSGSVNATNGYTGGLIGCADAPSALTVTGCENSGSIGGTYYVGGLIGDASQKTCNLSLSSCTASGSLSGIKYMGGLIGRSYTENADIMSVTNCTSTATVNGTSFTGGLIGYHGGRITVKGCNFGGTLRSNAATGGLIGVADTLGVGTLTVEDSTVSGTIEVTMNESGPTYVEEVDGDVGGLAVGGLVAIARGETVIIRNNAFEGTLNVAFESAMSERKWHRYAGAILGGFSDAKGAGQILYMYGNTVSGTMKVVDNSTAEYNGGYNAYAGIFLGCTNGQSRIEYIGGNTVEEGFRIDSASDVEIYKGAAVGGDMLKVEGYQISQKDEATGTYNLRFVASTRGDYDAFGFVLSIKYTDTNNQVNEKLTTVYAKNLYTSIHGGADKDGDPITYAAEDYNQKYFYTLEVRGVPAEYVEAEQQTFGITLLPFGVISEEVESITTYTHFSGVPATYGELPTGEAENEIDLENVGEFWGENIPNAMYNGASPVLEIAANEYQKNAHFGIVTDESIIVDPDVPAVPQIAYPAYGAPYSDVTGAKNGAVMTYSVNGITEGTYDLVLKLDVRHADSRRLLMYLNEGQDAYLLKYDAEDVQHAGAGNDNACYVKVGSYTFKDGDTITFKIDEAIEKAIHIRGIYLMEPTQSAS